MGDNLAFTGSVGLGELSKPIIETSATETLIGVDSNQDAVNVDKSTTRDICGPENNTLSGYDVFSLCRSRQLESNSAVELLRETNLFNEEQMQVAAQNASEKCNFDLFSICRSTQVEPLSAAELLAAELKKQAELTAVYEDIMNSVNREKEEDEAKKSVGAATTRSATASDTDGSTLVGNDVKGIMEAFTDAQPPAAVESKAPASMTAIAASSLGSIVTPAMTAPVVAIVSDTAAAATKIATDAVAATKTAATSVAALVPPTVTEPLVAAVTDTAATAITIASNAVTATKNAAASIATSVTPAATAPPAAAVSESAPPAPKAATTKGAANKANKKAAKAAAAALLNAAAVTPASAVPVSVMPAVADASAPVVLSASSLSNVANKIDLYSFSDLPTPPSVAPAVSTVNVANKVEIFSVHETTPPRSTSPVFTTNNSVSNKIEMFTSLVESVTPGPQGSPKASPTRPISSRGTPTQPPSVIANGQVEVLPVTFPQPNSRSPSPPPSALRGVKSVVTSQTSASLTPDIAVGAVPALPTESVSQSVLTSAAEVLTSTVTKITEGIASVPNVLTPITSQAPLNTISVTETAVVAAASVAPMITTVPPVPSTIPLPPYTPVTLPTPLPVPLPVPFPTASGVPAASKAVTVTGTETVTAPAPVTKEVPSFPKGIGADSKTTSKDASDVALPSTNIKTSAPSTPPRPVKTDDIGTGGMSVQTDTPQRPEKTTTYLFDVVFNQTSSQSAGMRISDLKLSYMSQSGELQSCPNLVHPLSRSFSLLI